MALAKQRLERLSEDPEVRRLAQEREDEIKLYRMELVASETRGKAEALLKLLGLRFGDVPDTTRVIVTSATPEQVDAWLERVLEASTLDEVLAA